MFSKLNTSFRRVISSSRRLLATTSSTSTTVQQQQQKLKGWRKYAQQFRDKPASYMTTFAILHEVTAIVPLPIVYYALDYSEIRVPVPEQAVAEGNRIMSKLRTRYGFEPLPADSQVMVNLATSYAVVKALMPLRIAISVALTPFFAERLVGPVITSFTRIFRSSTKTVAKGGP